jgi:hypothetical protein
LRRDAGKWWDALLPWLHAVRISAGGPVWTGCDPADTHIDLDSEEGPIMVRSVSGGEAVRFRRTFAVCPEYILDLAFFLSPKVQPVEWSLKASHMKPLQPLAFPREGADLPLEARWVIEWTTLAGPRVRTSGESARGTIARWNGSERPHTECWSLIRKAHSTLFTAIHEPTERPRVQATFALMQEEQYTVRVTGNGFFDYWMLDPAHTPAPLRLSDDRMLEVGTGWGFVRLEHGKETAYGALRRDWGLP